MRIIIDIDEDQPSGDEFVIEQLKWMEKDREAGGYIALDGTNYAFAARVAGVVPDDLKTGESYRLAAWLTLEEA